MKNHTFHAIGTMLLLALSLYHSHAQGLPPVQEAYLKASNTGAQDWFGWSVAISGDTLVVSWPGESSSATGVYFEGDAPGAAIRSGGVFYGSAFVTVFYRAGAAGWNPTFAGRPTAVWIPRPAFGDWAVSTGLAAQFPNASAEGDDPDRDGFTNDAEGFAATDPTQRASRLGLEFTPRAANLSESDQTPIEPSQHAVPFRSVPGHHYGVERATSLGDAWELPATKVAAATQTRSCCRNRLTTASTACWRCRERTAKPRWATLPVTFPPRLSSNQVNS